MKFFFILPKARSVCTEPVRIKAKCDSDIQKLDKCKLKALFENTDFEWLLKLSDDKKKVSKDVCTDSMEYFEK